MIDITKLEERLRDELNYFVSINSITDETYDELKFITKAFYKFFINLYEKDEPILNILNSFDSSLEMIASGFFGTGFKTNAIYIYKKLPVIIDILSEGYRGDVVKNYKEKIEELEKNTKELSDRLLDSNIDNDLIKNEIKQNQRIIKSKNDEIEKLEKELKEKIREINSRSSSSSSGYSGGSSGCGGSSSRSRC